MRKVKKSIKRNSERAGIPSLELLTLGIALISLALSYYTFSRTYEMEEKTLTQQRNDFQQNMIHGFQSHNWRFLENWNNKGVRPQLGETQDLDSTDMGRRVVLFDHLYILWQVYIVRDALTKDDLESYRNWARNWYGQSLNDMRVIFYEGNGDLFPLDFICWLESDVFDCMDEIFGDNLSDRLRKHKSEHKTTTGCFDIDSMSE